MSRQTDWRPAAVTDQEAAKILGCGVSTVRRMRYTGQLPTVRIGARGVRIPLSAIEKLLSGAGADEGRRDAASRHAGTER